MVAGWTHNNEDVFYKIYKQKTKYQKKPHTRHK